MRTIDSIPTSKLKRAANIAKTGVKVGANYVSYFGEKLVNNSDAKENLDKRNAEDIYEGLTELKGSTLKVAQMLSMEKDLIPKAYSNTFAQAQYSVPPISAPLVKKTFKKHVGQAPEEVFDTFDLNSHKAASIGQVHRAEKDGVPLAVKIQYPGVAESISSDLALVKPIALRMLNLDAKSSEKYFKEVEEKLLEETQYDIELRQGNHIINSCAHIPNLVFPKYYEELSNERILTMSWIEGQQLSEFVKTNKDPKLSSFLGQTMWDFYLYQLRALKMVHADPHPGNFIISDGKLGVIDFGCIKEIPDEFFEPYFAMTDHTVLNDPEAFEKNMYTLEILRSDDSEEEKAFFLSAFHDLLSVFAEPFNHDTFDFGDKAFFQRIVQTGERYADKENLKSFNANRGSKHFLYINRTFYGLYNLLHELEAKVNVRNYLSYVK